MKKIKFPLLLSVFLLVVLASGFFTYIDQREKHIQSEKQKLVESSRVAASEIQKEIQLLRKDFSYICENQQLNSFVSSAGAPDKSLASAFERLFFRFESIIMAIHVFDNSGKSNSILFSPEGSLQIKPGAPPKTSDLQRHEGVYIEDETMNYLVQSPCSKKIGVSFAISVEHLISRNLISVGKLRQSLRLLVDSRQLQSADSLVFHCFDEKFAKHIEIKIDEHLIKSATSGIETISNTSAIIKGVETNFFLLLTPLQIDNQSIILALLLERDNVLELVNATHFIFMVFFAFFTLFALMLIILRFTLTTQNSISNELAIQSNLFSLIINSMPIGVAVKEIRDDKRYIICNLAAARIFNRPLSSIIGHTDEEIFPEETAQMYKLQDKHLEETFDTEIVEKELANFGAGGVWLRTTRLPLFSSEGEPTMLMRVVEDITSSVKLESQLHHSQRMDEIGKLAGGIAHEFNNLLQVILGYCEFIKTETTDETVTTNIDQIEKAGRNAMRLTRQLLTYSRKTEMKKELVDISRVVSDGLRMLTRFIGDAIEIVFIPSSEPVEVMADSAQIEQILVNLCVNARDAMNGKGQIIISIEKVTEVQQAIDLGIRRNMQVPFAHVRVADNGPGIPDNLRNRIFEPFFTTKEVGKGTGLGLAIVYAILKQHEGYIFLDQNTELGSAFDFYLPIVISSISEEKKTGESAIQTNLNASSHLILVAEDEEAVRQMCVKLLKKQGFRVIEATNGEEALELFNANADRISLMIFDVMMPKMTGKMAYDQIRKINKTIPTIFCTGYSDEVLKAELNGQANVILLDKPYKTTKLLETIYKLLTRS